MDLPDQNLSPQTDIGTAYFQQINPCCRIGEFDSDDGIAERIERYFLFIQQLVAHIGDR